MVDAENTHLESWSGGRGGGGDGCALTHPLLVHSVTATLISGTAWQGRGAPGDH